MKFSESWVREWVSPDIDTQAMCDQLTMAGLEVDGVEEAAGKFSDVVVARVESLAKHPDADKLNVCQVNDGSETKQIVCGAANVRQGLVVALARVGAILPGEKAGDIFTIKPAKLRGVESFGMLCSEKELGIAETADGLMELPEDAPLGINLREYLQLDDTIIELDLTPNRGDCLSISGIARELGVLNLEEVNALEVPPVADTIKERFPVEITADEACTQYAGRIIKGINAKAMTPLWMLEKLRRSGIRGLSPVVDITNYVLLELGQPMHAFDLQKLHGKISVRFANNKESLTLLDGKTVELQNDSLVIADDDRALALAGVMGGEYSAVVDSTTDIFLESAFFKPEIIAGKARNYGMHTDSSHRFERGVDTELQGRAIERATQLICDICGGEVGPINLVTTEHHPKEAVPIDLRRSQIKRVLGIKLGEDQVTEMFERLGMQVREYAEGWLVKVPSFRFDIQIEADLLEELVRIYGYNKILRTRPSYHAIIQSQPEAENVLTSMKQILVDRGYYEAISYSFVDPKWQDILDPAAKTIALANPLSSEMSVMRTTLWAGLLSSLKHNVNRQQSRVRLFETGLCFRPNEAQSDNDEGIENIVQTPMFAGVICGDLHQEQWADKPRKVDFFDAKADLESLLFYAGDACTFETAEHPALHPGQSARILQNDEVVGWIGALHPQAQKALDIEQRVYMFELEQKAIGFNKIPSFKPLSRFPEVRRDLAILVDETVAADEILTAIRAAGSELLKETQLFDIYQGKGVEEGRKSVAFGLILQEFSRTLTDQEVDTEIENIVSTLNQQFAATLRE